MCIRPELATDRYWFDEVGYHRQPCAARYRQVFLIHHLLLIDVGHSGFKSLRLPYTAELRTNDLRNSIPAE